MNYSENGEQYHIGLKDGDVGKYVLLPGDPKRCKKIADYFDEPVLIADRREFTTYTGYLNGEKVSVTSTGIGGASASIALEELVKVGDDTFIRVGTCGGIDLNVKGGDFTGVVQCKDSFYGQHNPGIMPVNYELENKWEAWKRLGCLASEMESAALFIVSSFLRVKTGSVFLTVANQEREKQGLENPVVHDTDKAIKTAIEALKILIEKNKQ